MGGAGGSGSISSGMAGSVPATPSKGSNPALGLAAATPSSGSSAALMGSAAVGAGFGAVIDFLTSLAERARVSGGMVGAMTTEQLLAVRASLENPVSRSRDASTAHKSLMALFDIAPRTLPDVRPAIEQQLTDVEQQRQALMARIKELDQKAVHLQRALDPTAVSHARSEWEIFHESHLAAVKAKEEAERKAREEAERKAREEAERREAERRAKEEAERKAREEAERKAREEAERREAERREAERREAERREAERREAERREAERREAERREAERREAERRAKEEAERKAREEAERRAREEQERKAREEAERKAREEAERRAREEQERRLREEAERRAREEAERKAREEADRRAREEAERKAREEADRRAREEAERRAREEADRKARLEAERKAKEEADRRAMEEVQRKAREHAEHLARIEAERKAKEDAERKAQDNAAAAAAALAAANARAQGSPATPAGEKKKPPVSPRLAARAPKDVDGAAAAAAAAHANGNGVAMASATASLPATPAARPMLSEAQRSGSGSKRIQNVPLQRRRSFVTADLSSASPNDKLRLKFSFETPDKSMKLNAGDVVTLIKKADANWWLVSRADGKRGLCPVNYIERYFDGDSDQQPQQQQQQQQQQAAHLPESVMNLHAVSTVGLCVFDSLPSVCLFDLSTCLSIYLSIHLSVYLSIHPPIYLSIYLSICPSISHLIANHSTSKFAHCSASTLAIRKDLPSSRATFLTSSPRLTRIGGKCERCVHYI